MNVPSPDPARKSVIEPSKSWFHGSPFKLAELKPGSTITQDRELAAIFSHKPRLVSIGDDGTIKHDGRLSGFLYLVSEPVAVKDVCPVPRSTMLPGKEWLTRRVLQVELLAPTQVSAQERLSRWEKVALHLRLFWRQVLAITRRRGR